MIILEEVKKDLIIAAKLIKTHCKAGSCYECVFTKNTDSSKCPLDKPPYYWDLDDLKIIELCNDKAKDISADDIERNYNKNRQKTEKCWNEIKEKHLQELKDEIERLKKQIEEKGR